MAGLKVVPVKTHADGNLDLEDLKAKAEKHKNNLAVFMVSFFAFLRIQIHSRADYIPLDIRCL
jgi:glycine cleavage system protein P-like pyridoxal-binding family